MNDIWAKITAALLVSVFAWSIDSAIAQQVDRNDLSQPSPGEIGLASECRDIYTKMRAVEKRIDAKNNDIGAMDTELSKIGQKLDELEAAFQAKSAKSQESTEAYQAALEAKKAYEEVAVEHNKLIDKQTALGNSRSTLYDEFYVLNPDYVRKCSGTIFKALSVILTCKDEKSDWCDLLE